jgi:hypothetical protein
MDWGCRSLVFVSSPARSPTWPPPAAPVPRWVELLCLVPNRRSVNRAELLVLPVLGSHSYCLTDSRYQRELW